MRSGFIPSRDDQEQLALARRILHQRVHFAHQPDGQVFTVAAMTDRGMVEIEGIPWQFAPHLFVLAGNGDE